MVVDIFHTTVDDYNIATWVHRMKSKFDSVSIFKIFQFIYTQINFIVKIIRMDNTLELVVMTKSCIYITLMVCCIKLVFLIHLSRTGWLNKNIKISWKLAVHYFFSQLYLQNIGMTVFSVLYF